MAGLNISLSILLFIQPLSSRGHVTDNIAGFAVRSPHAFNTLIAARRMIDKGAGGWARLKGGRGTWVDFKEIHEPPPISHLPLVSINLARCGTADETRSSLHGWGGEERRRAGEATRRGRFFLYLQRLVSVRRGGGRMQLMSFKPPRHVTVCPRGLMLH